MKGVNVVVVPSERQDALLGLHEDGGGQFITIRDGSLPWDEVKRLRRVMRRVRQPKKHWAHFGH